MGVTRHARHGHGTADARHVGQRGPTRDARPTKVRHCAPAARRTENTPVLFFSIFFLPSFTACFPLALRPETGQRHGGAAAAGPRSQLCREKHTRLFGRHGLELGHSLLQELVLLALEGLADLVLHPGHERRLLCRALLRLNAEDVAQLLEGRIARRLALRAVGKLAGHVVELGVDVVDGGQVLERLFERLLLCNLGLDGANLRLAALGQRIVDALEVGGKGRRGGGVVG